MKKRPPLNKSIAVSDFKNFYWLKEELVAFCRAEGISPSGGKIEIAARIEHFLNTGETIFSTKTTKKKITSNFDWKNASLSRETIITDNYKNGQNIRHFFEEVIGKRFSFNIIFMKWMKENIGKTLGDAAEEWLRIEAMKKDKNYKSEIPPQLEYNRYFRAFFEDNPNAKKEDAIRCWKRKKALPGTNIYERNDLDFLKNSSEKC